MNQTPKDKPPSWGEMKDRAKATLDFSDHLMGLPEEERKQYIYDPDNSTSDASKNAKAKFAEIGGFPHEGPGSIPEDVVFQVYEYDPKKKRDRLVTMVLPDPTKPKAKPLRATDIWLCTWPPYTT